MRLREPKRVLSAKAQPRRQVESQRKLSVDKHTTQYNAMPIAAQCSTPEHTHASYIAAQQRTRQHCAAHHNTSQHRTASRHTAQHITALHSIRRPFSSSLCACSCVPCSTCKPLPDLAQRWMALILIWHLGWEASTWEGLLLDLLLAIRHLAMRLQ